MWIGRLLTPIGDADWNAAVRSALDQNPEVIVATTQWFRNGPDDWFIVRNHEELARVIASVSERGAIDVLAGPALPYRGTDAIALQATARTIEPKHCIVVGCQRAGDPRLRDVLVSDEPDEIDAWFGQPHEGEIVLGQDPYYSARAIPGSEMLSAYGELAAAEWNAAREREPNPTQPRGQ